MGPGAGEEGPRARGVLFQVSRLPPVGFSRRAEGGGAPGLDGGGLVLEGVGKRDGGGKEEEGVLRSVRGIRAGLQLCRSLAHTGAVGGGHSEQPGRNTLFGTKNYNIQPDVDKN